VLASLKRDFWIEQSNGANDSFNRERRTRTYKDAIDGVVLAVNLAQIYSWTDEKDLAIEQIAAVERVSNYLTYGLLKLHPYWDSLRGDPRFEQIVASLAPKETR